ncbi:warA [Symbiodinium sp. CCMP2592]|nr:warA [Symbiodinium sp. CCMP2592]
MSNQVVVWTVAGQKLATLHLRSVSTVRALKQHLQGLCGQPRFRQRLLHRDHVLENRAWMRALQAPIDLQLVIVPYTEASEEQLKSLCTASGSGILTVVEEMLQLPLDPNACPKALIAACFGGHNDVVRLLLEAGADRSSRDGFWTPMRAAFSQQHYEVLLQLWQPFGLDPWYLCQKFERFVLSCMVPSLLLDVAQIKLEDIGQNYPIARACYIVVTVFTRSIEIMFWRWPVGLFKQFFANPLSSSSIVSHQLVGRRALGVLVWYLCRRAGISYYKLPSCLIYFLVMYCNPYFCTADVRWQ